MHSPWKCWTCCLKVASALVIITCLEILEESGVALFHRGKSSHQTGKTGLPSWHFPGRRKVFSLGNTSSCPYKDQSQSQSCQCPEKSLLSLAAIDSAKPTVSDTCLLTWSTADRTAWEHRQMGWQQARAKSWWYRISYTCELVLRAWSSSGSWKPLLEALSLSCRCRWEYTSLLPEQNWLEKFPGKKSRIKETFQKAKTETRSL